MQYAKVVTPAREALVALEPSNWSAAYQSLFDQTDVSGHELFVAYSHNNFSNPLQKSDEARYKARGGWAEILHDVVEHREPEALEVPPGEGFVPVLYIAGAGLPHESRVKGWLPRNGLYVPVADNKGGYRFFKADTLIPERVIPFTDRAEVEKAFSEFNLPPEQISGFYRIDNYRNNKRFVGRCFGPGWDGHGRFFVDAGRLPSSSGNDGVASRPAYGKPEIVMTVEPWLVKAK